MKKAKKFTALACAGVLTVAQAVPAFADGSLTANIGVENDNSALGGVYDVVLPVDDSNIYNFTLDPENLLGQFGDGSVTDTVVFENSIAEVYEEASGSKKLGIKDYKNLDTGTQTDLTALFVPSTKIKLEDVDDTMLADYAVWVPSTGEENVAQAKGEFLPLTAENFRNYINLTFNASGEITAAAMKGSVYTATSGDRSNLAGENVYSGELYKKAFVELDSKDIAKYVTLDEETLTVSAVGEDEDGNKLQIADDANGTNMTDAAPSDITYTAPSKGFTSTSDKGVIINKSLSPILITVDATINEDCGLNFAATSTVSGDDNIYLALKKGSTEYAVQGVTVDEATTYSVSEAFAMDGIADAGSIKYQGTDFDEVTGSHNYHSYLVPNASAPEMEIELTATISSDNAFWKNYVAKLRAGEATKPTASIVFGFDEGEGGLTQKVSGTEYANANTKTNYTVDTNGKVTAITKNLNADEVGFEDDGTNCTFALEEVTDLKTVTVQASYDKGGTWANLSGVTTAEGSADISFKSSTIKSKTNVMLKLTFGTTTYVITIK